MKKTIYFKLISYLLSFSLLFVGTAIYSKPNSYLAPKSIFKKNYSGLVRFSTKSADYIFHKGMHIKESIIPSPIVMEADAVVLESSYPYLDVNKLDVSLQEKDLIKQAYKYHLPVYNVDVASNLFKSNTANFLLDVFYHLFTFLLPALFCLVGALITGDTNLYIFIFYVYGLMLSLNIILVMSPAAKLSSLFSIVFFFTHAGFRSAIAAEKIEETIAPSLPRNNKPKPVIMIEYGAGHIDIITYLKFRKLRKLVLFFHKMNVLNYFIYDEKYFRQVQRLAINKDESTGKYYLIPMQREMMKKKVRELLKSVTSFADEVNENNYCDLLSKHNIAGELNDLIKIAGESDDDEIRNEINGSAYRLFKKLQRIPALTHLYCQAIRLIGATRIGNNGIKNDLIEILRRVRNTSRVNGSLLCAYFAAEALGRLFGDEILDELLTFVNCGENGVLYGEVLQGAMLAFAEIGQPRTVKEIFTILKVKNISYDSNRDPNPNGIPLCMNSEIALDLIESAVDALSRLDEEVIKASIRDNFTKEELADLLTAYYNLGDAKICRGQKVYYPEYLFNLILPYCSASVLIDAMQYMSERLRDDIVRFAPYGLRAELLEKTKVNIPSTPNREHYRSEDLIRKQEKLNDSSAVWGDTFLTDEEIQKILRDIDSIVSDTCKGPVSRNGRDRASLPSIEILKYILPAAPQVEQLINGGTLEERITAARELQKPEVLQRLLDLTNTWYGSLWEEIGIVARILGCIFRLNQNFAVKYLSQKIATNRYAYLLDEYKIFAPKYLGMLSDERALPYLVKQALYSAIPAERYRAINAIRDIGGHWAVEFLMDIFMATKDPFLKKLVIEAMGGIKHEDIIIFLKQQVSLSVNKEFQEILLFALVRAGDKETADYLLQAMESGKGLNSKLSSNGIASQLWRIIVPQPVLMPEKLDSTSWRDRVIKRLISYTVRQIMKIIPDEFSHVGRFRIHYYSPKKFNIEIVPLFDRLTALPVEDIQSMLDETLPNDEEYARFLLAILPTIPMYPSMKDVLACDRTKKVIENLNREEAKAYREFYTKMLSAGTDTRKDAGDTGTITPPPELQEELGGSL